MWTFLDWREKKEGNFKEWFLILCILWGKSFSNLSAEEGLSALGREFCHNTKQIAYQHPGEVHISPGKLSCKDDFSKDVAQKHGAPGNRSPVWWSLLRWSASIISKADVENYGCCHTSWAGKYIPTDLWLLTRACAYTGITVILYFSFHSHPTFGWKL